MIATPLRSPKSRTQQTTLAFTAFVVALLGARGAAHADAIMPPRGDCAPGAVGRSSHAGQWCTPTTCNADADCRSLAERESMFGGGDHTYTCRAIDLCVRTETYQLGGRRRVDDPSENTGTREIASSCTPSCDAPASCTHEKRCVRSDVAPTPTPTPAPPPAPAASTITQGTATPAAANDEQSGDGCAISPAGASGPALVVLGALALLAVHRTRRSARRLPPR